MTSLKVKRMSSKKECNLKEKASCYKELDVDSVFCIACRCIYIRPVTMPCKHTLCLECFKNMVNITSYQCPTCRKRISNWLRKFKNDWDSLVNENLWEAIQQQYPLEVERKLNDEDDGLEDRIIGQDVLRVQNKQGEIKKEFDKMRMLFLGEQKEIELQNLKLAKHFEEEEEAHRRTKEELNKKLVQDDMKLASTIQENLILELQQEQTMISELDKNLAIELQRDMSLEFNDSMENRNVKNKASLKENNHKGPLDKLFSTMYRKNAEIHEANKDNSSNLSMSLSNTTSLCNISLTSSLPSTSSCNISLTSSLPSTSSCNISLTSSLHSTSSYSSTSSIMDSNIFDHDNIDTCTCGRLENNSNSKVLPCQFCNTQIELLNKLKIQQNDFKVAKKLEKELNKIDVDYNLRKRSNSTRFISSKKKIRKLSKGQLTLLQNDIWKKL